LKQRYRLSSHANAIAINSAFEKIHSILESWLGRIQQAYQPAKNSRRKKHLNRNICAKEFSFDL
jgi:hypothetical protein